MPQQDTSRQSYDSRVNPLTSAVRRGCSWISKLGKLRTNAPVLSAPGQHYPPYLALVPVEDRPYADLINKNLESVEANDDQSSNSISASHEAMLPTYIDLTMDDERDDQGTWRRFYSVVDAPASPYRSKVAHRYVRRMGRSLLPGAASTISQTKESGPEAALVGSKLNDESSPSTNTTTSQSSPNFLPTSIDRSNNGSLTEGEYGFVTARLDAALSSPERNTSPQARLCVERHIKESRIGQTLRHLGIEVSVLSESLKVFVIHLLPPETCELIRSTTQEHVNHMNAIGCSDMTYRALYTYTEMDIPCCEIAGLMPLMDQTFACINRIIAHVLGEPQAVHLKPRSWTEPHILKYDHEQNHTGIIMHHDGSDFTWSLMLSHSSEYTGGGTYIRALRQTIKLRQGQVLVHPGDLFHQGLAITSGTRELVVCFLDGHASNVEDPSKNAADNETFKKNVLLV